MRRNKHEPDSRRERLALGQQQLGRRGRDRCRKRQHMAAVAATTFTTDTPLPLRASSPPPQLQIKTIIVPGQKTTDGQLVEAAAVPWFEIVEMLKRIQTRHFKSIRGCGKRL